MTDRLVRRPAEAAGINNLPTLTIPTIPTTLHTPKTRGTMQSRMQALRVRASGEVVQVSVRRDAPLGILGVLVLIVPG
jgi:hypothetical protein